MGIGLWARVHICSNTANHEDSVFHYFQNWGLSGPLHRSLPEDSTQNNPQQIYFILDASLISALAGFLGTHAESNRHNMYVHGEGNTRILISSQTNSSASQPRSRLKHTFHPAGFAGSRTPWALVPRALGPTTHRP